MKEQRCSAKVYDGRCGSHQCNRRGIVQEIDKKRHKDSTQVQWWCKQHSPSYVEAKKKAWHDNYNKETARKNKVWQEAERLRNLSKDAVEVIKQIAQGHNDARSLATEILKKHNEPF